MPKKAAAMALLAGLLGVLAPAMAQQAMTDGEVTRIDKAAGKLTIKHGPIVHLDMPPMTMVFRVDDPALLDQVAPGDRIRFLADRIGGQFVVSEIEARQ